MDRAQLKENAKKIFQKKYWYCVIVAFLMTLSTGGASRFNFNYNVDLNGDSFEEFSTNGFSEFFSNFLSSDVAAMISVITIIAAISGIVLGILIFSTLRCGGIRFFMKLRKNHKVEINEVVANFRDKTFLNIAKISFFKGLNIFLWSLLFIIPGILKTYEYWAIDYVLAVRPDMDKEEAFSLSKTIMNGNKLDLFVLEISFIGWDFLSVLTASLVGIFYANPYKQATYVEFFGKIRNDAITQGKITPFDVPDYEMVQEAPPVFNQYQNSQYQNTYYQNNVAQPQTTAENNAESTVQEEFNNIPQEPNSTEDE